MKRTMHTTARRPFALLLALLLLCTLALTGCEKEKPEDVVADMNALLESVKGGSTAEVAFLYGMTPDELSQRLGVKLTFVANDGCELMDAILGII